MPLFLRFPYRSTRKDSLIFKTFMPMLKNFLLQVNVFITFTYTKQYWLCTTHDLVLNFFLLNGLCWVKIQNIINVEKLNLNIEFTFFTRLIFPLTILTVLPNMYLQQSDMLFPHLKIRRSCSCCCCWSVGNPPWHTPCYMCLNLYRILGSHATT